MGNQFFKLFSVGFEFIGKIGISKSTLWGLGLTLAMKLFDLYLDKYKENKAMKEAYVKFLEQVSMGSSVSVRIKEASLRQIEKLKKLEQEIK